MRQYSSVVTVICKMNMLTLLLYWLFELAVLEVGSKQIINDVVSVVTFQYPSSLFITLFGIPAGSWDFEVRPYLSFPNSKCHLLMNNLHYYWIRIVINQYITAHNLTCTMGEACGCTCHITIPCIPWAFEVNPQQSVIT